MMNGDIAGVASSLVIFILDIFFPLFVWYIIYKNKHRLDEEFFQMKFGSLYADTNSNSLGVYYCVVYLVRRMTFAITVVFFVNYPCFQLQLTLLVSIATLIYIKVEQPFQ
mmetsp:Transcript_39101/g.37420  ORF Transcript_39101/g.37420 Transcript_39101/m.37420 type:complete len:110 (-) Transcript_39101:837-1166(-)